MPLCLSLKRVQPTASGQPYCFICPSKGRGHTVPSTEAQEGKARERPTSSGGPTPSTKADFAVSSLCKGSALFHPVLHCTVLSLKTLMPSCNGQERLESSSGVDNQCTVLWLTSIEAL